MKYPLWLAGVCTAAMVSSAAEANRSAEQKGFYIEASAVAFEVGDLEVSGNFGGSTPEIDFETRTGFQIRGGYDFGQIRTDLEFGYLNAEVDVVSGATNGNGDVDVWMGLISGTMDFDLGGGFSPYASLGVGAIRADGDVTFTDAIGNAQTVRFHDFAPATTAGLGLGYQFYNRASAHMGYQVLGIYADDIVKNSVVDVHILKLGINFYF